MRCLLFISVDDVAKYAGYGVFFEEKHLFRGLCEREHVRKEGRVERGISLGHPAFRRDPYMSSEILPLQIFAELLREKLGGSSPGEVDIFEIRLFRDILHRDGQGVEEHGKKGVECLRMFLVFFLRIRDDVFDVEMGKLRLFFSEGVFEQPESEIQRVSAEDLAVMLQDDGRFRVS